MNAPTVKNTQAAQHIAGFDLGILCIPGIKAILQGNIQHAASFEFPVLYEILEDVSFDEIGRGSPDVLPSLIKGARHLQDQGVNFIIGACGSFGHYQIELQQALDIPIYSSILLQVPSVLQSLSSQEKLLVVFANKHTFTDKIRFQCGIDSSARLQITDMSQSSEFEKMFLADHSIMPDRLCDQLIQAIDLVRTQETAAILLQCSDLPPFTSVIEQHFGLPVFDMRSFSKNLVSSSTRPSTI